MIELLAQATPAGGLDTALIAGFALFGLALVLAALELVVPSAGVIAMLCALCILAGVVSFFVHSMLWGFASLAFALGGAPFAIGYGLRLWSTTPLARRAVLSTELEAAHAPRVPPVGARGTAVTDMRPVGRVEIDGRTIEAIAEGGFIEAGSALAVAEGSTAASLRVRAIARP
jgi:membrane-bound serine protease (ClpP class)